MKPAPFAEPDTLAGGVDGEPGVTGIDERGAVSAHGGAAGCCCSLCCERDPARRQHREQQLDELRRQLTRVPSARGTGLRGKAWRGGSAGK